ncbi:cytochrome b561 domain-containing protein At2g30890 [Carica papaya]|uniref:cytochrome b561 domain-containing protein At2g30890 n=1 Tax=Carica papaya TaxID=3649 RepID=UPI000B8CD503|nr:cytochrome b561 domain-containing protein At2g30890 [Carica papaya]
MGVVPKLVSILTCIITVVIVLVIPFVSSSQEEPKTLATHASGSKDVVDRTMSPKLQSEVTLHGFLLWASMGFLTPVGILAIRMSNRECGGRRLKILFYVHTISQIVAALLVTAGAVMSIKNFNNSFNNHHQRIGVALYGIIWLQVLLGFVRPSRGCKGRSGWFLAHWLMGSAMTVLGIINTYTGLEAYHEKTSTSIKLWSILFTCQISFIAFLYLFQDKWPYIQIQGVISGNLQPNHNHKESGTDPC